MPFVVHEICLVCAIREIPSSPFLSACLSPFLSASFRKNGVQPRPSHYLTSPRRQHCRSFCGLWRVDNTHNFDQNEWNQGESSIQQDIGALDVIFHCRLARGVLRFEAETHELNMDPEYDGPLYALRRYTVRNHQPELQIVPPTIAFAQYWFEFL
ncbi:hypothetical protein HID58_049654 [Brassica napus]|uniref:Uncharacterized protein n=1 Tax=Brassica napus TaxID=3708 RepID=A0ABQ8B5K8_BRANA|nr:hypothetical protein HID58_049654 [Brassica napus]